MTDNARRFLHIFLKRIHRDEGIMIAALRAEIFRISRLNEHPRFPEKTITGQPIDGFQQAGKTLRRVSDGDEYHWRSPPQVPFGKKEASDFH